MDMDEWVDLTDGEFDTWELRYKTLGTFRRGGKYVARVAVYDPNYGKFDLLGIVEISRQRYQRSMKAGSIVSAAAWALYELERAKGGEAA